MPITFLDFDLRIAKHRPDSYEVTAETRTEGRAGPEPLDWERLTQTDLQEKLRRLQEEPHVLRRTDFRDVGSQLFAALFDGQVLRLFTGIWDQQVQKRPDTYLRLRLDIDERAPEVAVLPWELLYWRDVHLATQIKTLISRQLLDLDYGAIGPLAIGERPSILVIIPSGSGLDTDAERQAITHTLTQADLPFDVLEGEVTLLRLADRLAECAYPILHFIGHGDFEEDVDGAWHGILRFNTADGQVDWVDQERLQALLSAYAATTRLIVLNACLGGVIGERRAMQPGRGFVGLAPALLRSGIPAVVAMQYEIGDSIAIQFAKSFYQRLTTGRWAGYVDTAVSLARNDCFLTDTRDRGFGTSVLYLRAVDGHLFDLSHPIPAGEANATPAEDGSDPARQQGKYNIHIGNAQGVVIGDQAQVTQTFGGGPSAGLGQSGARGQQKPGGDAARRHLQQQLVELQGRYDNLTKRIAALDTDLSRALDGEQKWTLQERRREVVAEREQLAEQINQLEQKLDPSHLIEVPSAFQTMKTLPTAATFMARQSQPPIEEIIRLDVAAPPRAMIGEPFALAVAVKQPESPQLSVEDLEQVVSGAGSIIRETESEVVKYRIEVTAEGCDIQPAHLVLKLRSGKDSPTCYFQITARHAGNQPIIVTAYQEDEALAAQTRISIQVALPVEGRR